MKIAIFSDNFYPEISGISDSIISLAKELDKLGHIIDFYVPGYGIKDYDNLEKRELILGNNIKINRLFSFSAPFAGAKARLVLPWLGRRFYKNFRPDIIHSQLFFGVGLEALMLAKFFTRPLIGTNHTAISEFVKYLPIKFDFLNKLSLNYAVWYYNRCNFVTAPSQSVFNEMSRHGFKRQGQVISNPIDTNTFCPSSKKLRYKKEFNLSNNTVIYVGRLSLEKNIDVIIKAIALVKNKISDINLAIAGAGKAQAELKQLVIKLGLKNEVKFLGALSHEKIAQLYAASEVFAIASTSETQSLVLMQAMACGLPAVAVDARGLPEYVNEKNGCLVKAGDEKSMAEKFILLLENNELRGELSQGAALYVKQFSAPSIAKEWEKLYDKTIRDFKNRA